MTIRKFDGCYGEKSSKNPDAFERPLRTFKLHGCYTMTVCVSTNGAPLSVAGLLALDGDSPMKLNVRKRQVKKNRCSNRVF